MKSWLAAIFILLLSTSNSLLLATGPFFQSSYYPTVELSFKRGNQRALARFGAFIPMHSSESGLWFSPILGLWDNQSAQEGNLGLGYRHQFNHWIIGGYGFFDRKLSARANYHSQVTLGAELLADTVEFRVNGYFPTTSAKPIHTIKNRLYYHIQHGYEKPLKGWDIEGGLTLPVWRIYLRYYYFLGKAIKTVEGAQLRGARKLNQYLSVIAELSSDRLRHKSGFIGIQLSFSLGGKKTKQTGLAKKMTQSVIRDIDVLTDQVSHTQPVDRIEKISLSKAFEPTSDLQTLDNAIIINHFTASKAIKNKISSIIIKDPKDIQLKPIKHHILSSSNSLIPIKPYDVKGVPANISKEALHYFAHQSYWHIFSIGKDYGVSIHARGLGGGDSEPRKDDSHHSQNVIYTASDGITVSQSDHVEVYSTTIVHKSPKPFKPKALGIRPSTNAQFVVRHNNQGEDVLELLKTRFHQSSDNFVMQVITGIGGMGKTQLAVEYIRQAESNYGGVFWVQAGTVPIDYNSFVDALAIDLKKISPDKLVQIIHKSLMRLGYPKVLWVYDDVPNVQIFDTKLFNQALKNIWYQAKTKVHVLITSRYQDWGRIIPIQLKLFDTVRTKTYIESFFKEGLIPFP